MVTIICENKRADEIEEYINITDADRVLFVFDKKDLSKKKIELMQSVMDLSEHHAFITYDEVASKRQYFRCNRIAGGLVLVNLKYLNWIRRFRVINGSVYDSLNSFALYAEEFGYNIICANGYVPLPKKKILIFAPFVQPEINGTSIHVINETSGLIHFFDKTPQYEIQLIFSSEAIEYHGLKECFGDRVRQMDDIYSDEFFDLVFIPTDVAKIDYMYFWTRHASHLIVWPLDCISSRIHGESRWGDALKRKLFQIADGIVYSSEAVKRDIETYYHFDKNYADNYINERY